MLRVSRFVALSFCGALSLSAQAVTPFQTDVSTAINTGLAYLAGNGVFNNPSSLGVNGASGIAMEALLEKRASGNPGDPPQGYTGASAADQALLRSAASYILNTVPASAFYAYRDGAWMFALSGYALTGGPDKSTLGTTDTIKQAMDALVDRTLANQCTDTPGSCPATSGYNSTYWGYWCYTNAFCRDSSTTQFAAAGLNAARVFYLSSKSADDTFADAVRVGQDRHRAGADAIGLSGQHSHRVGQRRLRRRFGHRARPRLPRADRRLQAILAADVVGNLHPALRRRRRERCGRAGLHAVAAQPLPLQRSGQHGQLVGRALLRLLPLELVQGDGAGPPARRGAESRQRRPE